MATAPQVAPAVGLRTVREARGMTQAQLITALLVRGSEKGLAMPNRESLRVAVSRWENGRLTPSREHLLLLADALSCAVSDLAGAPTSDHSGPPRPASPVSLERAGADFETILGQMIATDHLNGGAHVLMGMAEAGYRSLRDILRHGEALADLLAVAAKYAEFIGWLYQDQGQLGKARSWTRRAEDLALACNDDDLIAYSLMRRSAIESDMGVAEDALMLALSAQRYVRNLGTASLVARQVGHAHALAGDRRQSQEAMEQAAIAAEKGAQSGIAVYATVPYMLMEAGAAASRTGEHGRATGLLEQSLREWPEDQQARDRTLCMARLALAYAQNEQIDAAAEMAATAHQRSTTAASPRASAVLDKTTQLISRHDSLPEVVALKEVRRRTRS